MRWVDDGRERMDLAAIMRWKSFWNDGRSPHARRVGTGSSGWRESRGVWCGRGVSGIGGRGGDVSGASERPALGGGMLLLMTVAISGTIANLFYNQPLLPSIGASFRLEAGWLGLIPSASQLGYAAAILLISPLGDTMPRRRLIGYLSVLLVVALVTAFVAPTFEILLAACFGIGLGTNITQQLIPFGASLSTPEARGKVMGTMMTGLTAGILLSRTLSGCVAEYFGWRSVFLAAAVVAVMFGILMRVVLPVNRPGVTLGYPRLIGSMFTLVRKHRLLRVSALTGALWFAAFNALWATLAIHVTAEPFSYSVQQAGLFGLVGLSGIAGAKVSGRMVAVCGPGRLITGALLVVVAAFVVLAVFGDSLAGLIVGIVLLDLGVFGAQIPNQVRVFSIDATAHSRMNAVYMLCYFIAAAVGSAAGVKVMGVAGWHGLVMFGLGLTAVGLAVHLWWQVRVSADAPRPQPEPPLMDGERAADASLFDTQQP